MDGGSAGFADDEVVLIEEAGDFACPADDADAPGIAVLELLGLGIEPPDIAAENEGEMDGG
jgi:hypothetical protein